MRGKGIYFGVTWPPRLQLVSASLRGVRTEKAYRYSAPSEIAFRFPRTSDWHHHEAPQKCTYNDSMQVIRAHRLHHIAESAGCMHATAG